MAVAPRPARERQLDLAFLAAASVVAAVQFLRLHASIAPSAAPGMAFLRDPGATHTAAMGWWAWWDQGFYQRAAAAWANGVTDPVFHWYLPGYPLLGAAFARVTPADPFVLPNLASFLGTLWLFCRVATRLLADVPRRVPLACVLFVAASVLPGRVLWAWVVPWTTTPETFCIFAALLGAMRLAEGGRRRDAFVTGLATAAIAGFRPADAAVVGLAVCAVVGPAVLRGGRVWSRLAAAAGGAAVPVLAFGGAYLLTWGTAASTYLALSARIGFEPRLLALRWVTLMVDPRPLYPDGRGLMEVFAWMLPGFAGMAATLVAARGAAALPHRLVIAAVCGDVVMFLAYRDLHPTGLWEFGNHHYFKWMLPVLAVYAVRLLPIAARRDRRRPAALAAACLVVPALFCWRAGVSRTGAAQAEWDGAAVTAGAGLAPVSAMVLVPGRGPDGASVVDGSAVTLGGRALRYGSDFVIYNGKDVLRIIPLRPLPVEPTTFRFAGGTALDQSLAPASVRQTVTWGLPYIWGGKAAGPQGAPAPR